MATFNGETYWTESGMHNKRMTCVRGVLTADTEGATAGDLPASLFGLQSIEQCSNLIADDNSVIIPASPAVGGGSIITGGGESNAAADLSDDSYILTVKGY